jgi:hypothetical protein
VSRARSLGIVVWARVLKERGSVRSEQLMRMRMPLHPRAWIDALLTYPRFLGSIKPELMGVSAGQIEQALKLSCSGW